MKECQDLSLHRTAARSWGFRLLGGRDEGLVLRVDKVLGLDTPAAQGGLRAGDVLVQVISPSPVPGLTTQVEGQLVTMMTHPEVVQCIRAVQGESLGLRVQRGDHIVPSMEECFPARQEPVDGPLEDSTDYYSTVTVISRLLPALCSLLTADC
jgi:hypothetical protein